MSIDKDKQDILDEVAIGQDLSQEFARQASYFAEWGFAHATAEAEARRTEEAKDVTWAKLQLYYRRKHKSPKENAVKAWIMRHQLYRDVVTAWHQAKYHRDVLRVAVESFKQRKDMLIQLGADKRADLDMTDLSMRKKIDRANKVLRKVTKPRRRK